MSKNLKNSDGTFKGYWLQCQNPLNKPTHSFFLYPNPEWFELQRICCLCHDEQLSNEGYRKPSILRKSPGFVGKSTDSKPEKDSL